MLRPNELEIAANAPSPGCTPEAAQGYTRWLATHHYENFNVVSWLLPKELHQHFYNLYAYCRWADDLGDEVPETQRALELLAWWELELEGCYEGRPSHPVFIALRETIVAKEIPKQPFADLLKAFRQDQTVKRYPTWDAVLNYCVYSANPVGRLVLYLCGYRDEPRQRLSDATCTALQLANFWQDVSRDLEKGRIYIPLDAAAVQGLTEGDIVERRFDDRYVCLMKDLIAHAHAFCRRDASGKNGGCAPQCGPGDVQSGRAGRARCHRGDGLRHPPPPSGSQQAETSSALEPHAGVARVRQESEIRRDCGCTFRGRGPAPVPTPSGRCARVGRYHCGFLRRMPPRSARGAQQFLPCLFSSSETETGCAGGAVCVYAPRG